MNHIIGDMIDRIVLDTNVLIAAARSRADASFQLLLALRYQRFQGLASVPMMLEYEAVLKRPEHLQAAAMQESDADRLLDVLALLLEPVHLHFLWRPQLRDPSDDMVLETALNGRADALVTLNPRDFAPAAKWQMPVLSPGEYLWRLQSRAHQTEPAYQTTGSGV